MLSARLKRAPSATIVAELDDMPGYRGRQPRECFQAQVELAR